MKRLAIVSLLLLPICFAATVGNAESEFEKWKAKELGQYEEFRDKRDKAFTAYLKKQWEEFQLFQGDKFYKEPKPVVLPAAPQRPPEEGEMPFGGRTVTPAPPPPVKPPEEAKPAVPPAELPMAGKSLEVDFFGRAVSLRYDPELKISPPARLDEKGISAFWEGASRGDFEGLLKQMNAYKDSLQLNDWGYHRLSAVTAEAIYGPADQNGAALLTWFLLSKSGYDARAAYSGKEVFILTPSRNHLYGTSYLELNGKRYYALSFDGRERKMGSLFTYKGRYPGAERLMDYALVKPPRLTKKVRSKNLSFAYRGQAYTVPALYDGGMADLMEYYPQTDFEVYFGASVSDEAGRSLADALSPLIAGKTEGEAVNVIIRFVQTAFSYKTDDQQFGREKYLLPDETLYYPYSDCEDRSILFAYLVRRLVGLEVVGLHYPGHMATAVRFNSDVKGDKILFRGKEYLVCDPTYINADIGTAMPQFKTVKPEVIPIAAAS